MTSTWPFLTASMSGVTPVKSYGETCQNITRRGKTRARRKHDGVQILDIPLTSMSTGVASFKSWMRLSRFPSEDAFQRGETIVTGSAFWENGAGTRRGGGEGCGRRETLAWV